MRSRGRRNCNQDVLYETGLFSIHEKKEEEEEGEEEKEEGGRARKRQQPTWHIVNISHPREIHQPQFPVLNKIKPPPWGKKDMSTVNCGRYHCSQSS